MVSEALVLAVVVLMGGFTIAFPELLGGCSSSRDVFPVVDLSGGFSTATMYSYLFTTYSARQLYTCNAHA